MSKRLLISLTACLSFLTAQAQTDCPRIYRRGDTLFTDPAPQYQWFKGGLLINGAVNQWFLPGSKGDYSVEISGTSPNSPVILGPKSITGRIVDERYEPISEAKVSAGGRTVLTDKTGSFSLKDLNIAGNKTVLTVEKAGFWKNNQSIRFFGNSAPVTAMLEPLKVTNRFEAEKGATISERGFFLTFPPNAVVNDKGEAYKGTVHLSLKRSFPNEEGFGLRMPGGDFSAIDGSGNERMLVSYGFMSAEIQSPSGEKLNLAKDKEATLEFYLPWKEVKAAPDSMPLWHFDEANAVWRPEGMARKVGPRYMGTVKHFSSWNCDYPEFRATVTGRVLDCKGNPIAGTIVEIGQVTALTDSAGQYTRFVPAEWLNIQVTAGVDTLNISPLTIGEIRTLSDLRANHINDAIGIIDTAGVLRVFGYGLKEYSVDSGTTFHSKNYSIIFIFNYPEEGIARDSLGCETKFRIYTQPKIEDCRLLNSDSLSKMPWYRSIENAFRATEPVYCLGLDNFVSYDKINLALNSFSCVNILYLSKNELTEIPKSLFQLFNLQTVWLINNQITTIPEKITGLIHLRQLKLDSNLIATLPEKIGQLAKLEGLHINKNKLTTLPESIGRLSELQWLTVGYNQLTALPDSIGQLTNLNTLWSSHNQLTVLPESIGQLRKLRFLDLSNNQLTSLPESFGQLTTLQRLWLTNNGLTSLPESISNLKDNIEEIFLWGNPIPETERAKIRAWLPNTRIFF